MSFFMGKCFPDFSLVSVNPSVYLIPLTLAEEPDSTLPVSSGSEQFTLISAPVADVFLCLRMKERRFSGFLVVGKCALLGAEKEQQHGSGLLIG